MTKLLKIILLFVFCYNLNAQKLTVKITNLRNDRGIIYLSFFDDNKSLKNETPLFSKTLSKENIYNNGLIVSFNDIPPGTYGVALLDDENSNNEMDYRFFIPQEGYGFSNYYHTGISKPHIDEFSFNFGKQDLEIDIKIKYLN